MVKYWVRMNLVVGVMFFSSNHFNNVITIGIIPPIKHINSISIFCVVYAPIFNAYMIPGSRAIQYHNINVLYDDATAEPVHHHAHLFIWLRLCPFLYWDTIVGVL